MKTYPFGRMRGLLFLGLFLTMLLFGVIQKCTGTEKPIKERRDRGSRR